MKIFNTNKLTNINQNIIYVCQRAMCRLSTVLVATLILLSLSASWSAHILNDPGSVNDSESYLLGFMTKTVYAQAEPDAQSDNGAADVAELDEESSVKDSDGDGLNDKAEEMLGTDPNKADTDSDTLSDGSEILFYGTDPLSLDSDNDQLGDSLEVITYNTDPNNPDSDKDGLLDGRELMIHLSNPRNNDTDSDGMMDGLEVANGTSPLDPNDDKPCEKCIGNTDEETLSDDKNIVGIQLGIADSDAEKDADAGVEEPTIIASTHHVAPEDIVIVTIEGFALPNLGTATIDIIYDNNVLEPVVCNPDPEDAFNLVSCNMKSAQGQQISFNVTSLTGVTGDKVMAEIVFDVIGVDGDQSDIEVNLSTIADVHANHILPMVVNGYVAVSDACVNDTECDLDTVGTASNDTASNLESDETDVGHTADIDEIDIQSGQQQTLNRTDASSRIFIDQIPAGTTGSVTLPIMLQDATDVGTLSLALLYDTATMRATNCMIGEDVDLGQCNHKFQPGTIRFNAISTTGISGDLMLAEVTFDLLTPIEETLDLELAVEIAVDIHGANFAWVQ